MCKDIIFRSSNKSKCLFNFFIIFFIYIKVSKDSSAKYYEDYTERLQNKPRERHQNLYKEEKEKKRQYGHERYKTLPKNEKQNLVEYIKNIAK